MKDTITHALKSNLVLMGGGVLCLLIAFTAWQQAHDVRSLTETRDALSADIAAAERRIAERQVMLDEQKSEVIVDVSGFDPSLLSSDAANAREYFRPAFDWTSGQQYDETRDRYIESLGATNSFTSTYLAENMKIDVSDGEVSFIDTKGIKSRFDDLYVVPIAADGDVVRYVTFVRYYVYTDEKDLNNLSALAPSEAVIYFTVNGPRDARMVTDVEAAPGFSSASED